MATESGQTIPYVFLSYASADRDRALHVAGLLETHGIPVWIDRKSIAGGTSWSAEIVRGIESCAVLVVLSSTTAMASPNVQQEIQLAWEGRRPILPLLLESVRPPESIRYALAGRQWVEILDRAAEVWLPAVLEALRGLGLPGRGVVGPATPDSSPAASHAGAPPPRHNLPAPLTSFVGRETELAEVKRLLRSSRLLTLTGTGGCGKTRLALEVAGQIVDSYSDGVWLVELAPLAEAALVHQAVATAVSVREIGGRELTSVLMDGLRPRHTLLVVDNCEHLIDAVARLVDALLRGCPNLQILATSREILGAAGEMVWRVPSLFRVDPRQLPRAGSELVAAVAASAATRLFVERARQVAPGFQVTAENAAALAQICFRLDGIPLALELAAARLRTLSVDQLAQRLDDRFRLLTGGSRTALRRQQTLRALVDWSYDLLTEPEQVAFRRLAVFAGGFTLEAAEAVCAEGSPLEVQLDVLDLLSALVDKSLVVVDVTTGGEPRYTLLETLRAYARERLVASDEVVPIQEAHAAYYQALGVRETDLRRLQFGFAYSPHFLDEFDNFRAALRWFNAVDNWDGCVSLVGSSATFWVDRGLLEESKLWLDRALQHVSDVTPATRGFALDALGWLAFGRGDYFTAESFLREGLRLHHESSDARRAAGICHALGATLRSAGKLDEAETVLEEALRQHRENGLHVAYPLFQLGLLARQRGDLARAKSLLTATLHAARESGSAIFPLGPVLIGLGLLAEDEGALADAKAWYAQSIALLRQSSLRWYGPFPLEGFATLAVRQGDAERGVVLAGAAAAARAQMGNPIPAHLQARLDQALNPVREQLGNAAAAAWARGQALTLEQAFDYALEGVGALP